MSQRYRITDEGEGAGGGGVGDGLLAGLDDAGLVAALNRGERGAFDVLYRRYRDWAYRLAFRVVRDDGLAMDAVQESFVYLLTKFPGFELRAKLTTFLYPVVVHNAQAGDRKRRRKAPGGVGAEGSGVGDEGGVGGGAEDGEGERGGGWSRGDEVSGRLREAVSGLPEGQQEVLLMRVVQGMSVNEVAIALGVPTGTVKSRLHLALKALEGMDGLRSVAGGGGADDEVVS